MNTVTTRTLAALLCIAPLFAQGEKKTDTPASLVEQALYAEEHERDFARAGELFQRALDAARQANDAALLDRAQKGLDRVAARQRGATSGSKQNDPILCSVAKCLETLVQYPSPGDGEALLQAELDIQLYGAIAVPWIEKSIAGQFELCDLRIRSNPDRCIRLLAQMGLPESDAALKRALKSVDPLARRAVARFSNPDSQREILMLALQDSTPPVREHALTSLVRSDDPVLSPTIQTFARQAEWHAARWLADHAPIALLSIAADAHASDESRAMALDWLANSKVIPQAAAHVDALLAIARETSKPKLADVAANVLLVSIRSRWRPLEPAIAKQIETAMLASPAAYPQPSASLVLLAVGGGPALAAIAPRLNALAEPLPIGSRERSRFIEELQNQLGRLTPADFKYVAQTFRAIAPPKSQPGVPDEVFDTIQRGLRQLLVPSTPSVDIALGAEGLEGPKLEIYAAFASSWLLQRFGQSLNNERKLEREWLPFLRRLALLSNTDLRVAAARGLGYLADPIVLPDLIAMTGDAIGNVQQEANQAIQRVVSSDASRARRVIEDAMRAYAEKNGKYSVELAGQIELLSPTDTLALAEQYWKDSTDVSVRNQLYGAVCDDVPGTVGLEFLLRKWPETESFQNRHWRVKAIERFGDELYEPALDALGEALKDSDPAVRAQARAAFDAFKAQREALAEFAAWKATTNEARTTVDELVKLLESSNEDVVVGAVKALGALKASAAYPKLVRMLERKEPAIKAAAQAALDKLGE